LASKKMTIMVVPDGTKKIKQFRVSWFLLIVASVLMLSSAAFFTWIMRDYRAMRDRIPRLTQLEKENSEQKRHFLHLAQRIEQITQKMAELKQFDRKLKVMVNLEESEDEVNYQGMGGSEPLLFDAGSTMAKAHRDQVRVMHRSLDSLDQEIAMGQRDKVGLLKFLEDQKTLLACTPSIWPTRGWLSSGFGYRTSPFTGEKEFHKGIDISTRIKSPIVAPANGIVSEVGRDHGYGKMIFINHGYGLVTRYAHLEKHLVKKGQHVKRGETIGLVGNTGRSTGPHLHYEVILNGVPVNPLRYILN